MYLYLPPTVSSTISKKKKKVSTFLIVRDVFADPRLQYGPKFSPQKITLRGENSPPEGPTTNCASSIPRWRSNKRKKEEEKVIKIPPALEFQTERKGTKRNITN